MSRSLVRSVGRALLGPRPLPLIVQLARQDARWATFCDAADYINYERVPGDIVECGVFGGVSLALLARAISFDPKGMTRRVVGVDSFEGLPASAEEHARWREGDCREMHSPHPLIPVGQPISRAATLELFERCELPAPRLIEGRFDAVLPKVVPSELTQIALLHVDCDLYESTRDVFASVGPALQDGTILLFDDWFHYKGHPRKGEARAFHEFLAGHPEWGAVHYRSYATFCNAFILYRT